MSDDVKKEPGSEAGSPGDQLEEKGASARAAGTTPSRTEADDAAERAFEESAPGAHEKEEVDAELMRLPRRRRRHPLIALLVIGLSLYLMYFVKDDLLYFLQPRTPADLGDVSEALKEGKLRHNTHVSVGGAPDRKHALVLEARFGGYDSLFRLLQTGNRVFVQQHRASRGSDEMLSDGYTGQLLRFRSLPYHKALESYFGKTMTVAHDLDLAAVASSKASGGRSARDLAGATVQLGPDTPFWVNVAWPNEWALRASKRHHATLEQARKLLEGVEVPVAVDEDATGNFWRFVLHVEPDRVPVLMARFRNPDLHADLSRRQVSYSARWDQLSVEGKSLIINAADPTAPARYLVEKSGDQTKLSPSRETPTRVPAEAVLFISTSSPLSIPADAFVLLTGKRPGENWYYAVLYLLLLGFIAMNAATLVQRLRQRAR